jgi:hypothetical protein
MSAKDQQVTDNSYTVQPTDNRTQGSGMATASLVLGILALITSFTVIGGVVLGLLALIFGILVVRRAAPGRGRAIAGIVTGILGLVLAIVLIVVGVSLFNSKSVKDLRSCLKSAGSDQAKVQQCDNQYKSQVGGS